MSYFSAVPDAPSRTDRDNYASDAETFMNWFITFVPEAETFATEMEGFYDDAEAAKTAALAAADYQGTWTSVGSGALSEGQVVSHDGSFWMALTAIADASASEPDSANTDYQELYLGVPAGGSANQVLRKSSADDYDADWVDQGTQFDDTLSTDHSYFGDTTSEDVGESVVFGDLLYFNWADKEYKKASRDAETTMPVVAIALESKGDGEECLLLRRGWIRDDSWTFTDRIVMCSTSGAPTTSTPSTPGDQVQRIGQAKDTSIFFFNPDSYMVEVPT